MATFGEKLWRLYITPFLRSVSQTIEKEESKEPMASSSIMPEEGAEFIQSGINFVDLLPEGCISIITSFTTPADACRLALVSKDMLSASESDIAWQRFLPSDCDFIISRSDGEEALLTEFQSKKQLYKRLATQPLLVDQYTKSFWLERSSGKKCWMIAARSLNIAWGETQMYWRWTSNTGSRFPEAAELRVVCWFDVGAKIQTAMLSPSTQYDAYLVFLMKKNFHGFDDAFEASVASGGGKTTEPVYLDITGIGPKRGADRTPARRGDGWWEILIGEFFSNNPEEEDDEVELSVREVNDFVGKSGIIVQGIELRPSPTA